jgi:hypothetical protein
MIADQILADCRRIKEAGTSSKVPVSIVALEKLCADAKMWAETPAYVRDVVEALRASK